MLLDNGGLCIECPVRGKPKRGRACVTLSWCIRNGAKGRQGSSVVREAQRVLKSEGRRRAFLAEGVVWAKAGRDEEGHGRWGRGGFRGLDGTESGDRLGWLHDVRGLESLPRGFSAEKPCRVLPTSLSTRPACGWSLY